MKTPERKKYEHLKASVTMAERHLGEWVEESPEYEAAKDQAVHTALYILGELIEELPGKKHQEGDDDG